MRRGYWPQVWYEFKKNRLALAGLIFVLIMDLVAVAAPLLANSKPYLYVSRGRIYVPILVDYPELRDIDLRKETVKGFRIFPPVRFSPSEYDLDAIALPPSARHWMGTDEQGRDLLARMIHGSRVSIFIGFIAVLIYISIGIIIGSIAGYFGGIVDFLVSRFIEIVMCFPTFFLILTMLALMDKKLILYDPSGLMGIMVVIGITSWTGIARIVRGEFIRLREADFVIAARAMGATNRRIIARHILPNTLSPLLVSATFGIATTILVESSLSFLGFGVRPPVPSWGDILNQSRDFMDFAWWLTLFPGVAIFLTITSYNIVGEGLQEAIDPTSHRTIQTDDRE